MPHVLGWRATFGVIAPSTNTVVEPDYNRMCPPGVTAHMGRLHIKDQSMSDDGQMQDLIKQIRDDMEPCLERVMTCVPDYLVMGMSAETFWGGAAGSRAFAERVRGLTGLDVSTGADACNQALASYGVRRLGVITPYQPVGDEQVRAFFGDNGYDIVALKGLKCPTAVSISEVTEDELRRALLDVDSPDVEALIQVGTNLSMVRLADEAERWLGKPVIAINAATWWHALRANGISDQMRGFGGLLRDF